MNKICFILFISFFSLITYSNDKGIDSIIVKRIINQNDSLKAEIKTIHENIKYLQIDRKWFTSIINTQWSFFNSIIFILIALAGFFTWRKVIVEINKYKRKIDSKISKEEFYEKLKSIVMTVDSLDVNLKRGLYVGYYNANDFGWATIFAIRQIPYFVNKKDTDSCNLWISKAIKSINKPDINKDLLKSKAIGLLETIQNAIDSDYVEIDERAEELKHLIKEKVNLK
jgi:hypothetical protein